MCLRARARVGRGRGGDTVQVRVVDICSCHALQVEHCTTPTLVICGEKDWNVPVQNSDQLYQALRRLGVETQLVVYPDEHHGIARPSFERDRLERYLDWFGRLLTE